MTDTVSLPVEQASDEQLRWFIEHALGIPLTRKVMKRDELLARLHQAGHSGPVQVMAGHGTAPTPTPTPASPASPVASGSLASPVASGSAPAEGAALAPGSYQSGRKARIVIDRQDGPGGDRPVFVAVNGSSILIPRGEPVLVGMPYVEALTNATMTLFDQNPETGEITARDVPVHPFRILQAAA